MMRILINTILLPITILFIMLVGIGNRALHSENFDTAQRLFEVAQAITVTEKYIPANNRGNVSYQQKEYEQAIDRYQQALLFVVEQRGPLQIHAQILYNLGNAYYRRAEQLQSQGDISAALVVIDKAIQAYEDSLELVPTDRECQENLALAKKRKQELQSKQSGKESDQEKKQRQQEEEQNRRRLQEKEDTDNRDPSEWNIDPQEPPFW